MDLKKLMAEIEEQQVEFFKSSIKPVMDRKFYLSVFFGCFLGDTYFPMTEQQYNQIKNIDETKFNNYCHKIIDSISLCSEEIDFFHAMVAIMGNTNYIEQCLKLYHSIPNLDKCQLGDNILKCLQASKNTKIV